jgi:hypothetical protein
MSYIEENKDIFSGETSSVTDGIFSPEIRFNESIFTSSIIFNDPVVTVISPFESCYIIDLTGVYILDSNGTKIKVWQTFS